MASEQPDPAATEPTTLVDLPPDPAELAGIPPVTDPTMAPPPRAPSTPPTDAGWEPPPLVGPPPAIADDGGTRRFLVGAAIGAVVGALVAALVVVALVDDDPAEVIQPVVESPTDAADTDTDDPVEIPVVTDDSTANVRAVLDSVGPAVVSIEVTGQGGFFGGGAGSGFIVAGDGQVVTNAHVVESGGQITVNLPDGRTFPATVLGTDLERDLAVLDIEATGLPTVPLGSSETLQVGDRVIAIGNALGFGGSPTVTTGIVSALARNIQTEGVSLPEVIQTDAAINPGNSGGPLLNARGEVVGINTAVAGNAEGIGFAIPVDRAKPVIDSLAEGIVLEGPLLGVTVSDVRALDADVIERYDVEVARGAFIEAVTSGGAAELAGMRRGDIVIEINGATIDSSEALVGAIGSRFPGDELRLVVVREGEQRTFVATLGARTSTG